MEVKKFRASTTRNALELVKREMGEDAFVLETKRIQRRRLLGLRAESLVEISAAAAPTANGNGRETDRAFVALNLRDDTPASPVSHVKTQSGRAGIDGTGIAAVGDGLRKSTASRFEAVEISPEAPKIVHAKAAAPKRNEAAASIPAGGKSSDEKYSRTVASETKTPTVSNRELELLRAEIRELKISIGSAAARPSVYLGRAIDIDEPGELFDSPYFEAFMQLAETGIAAETARKIVLAAASNPESDSANLYNFTRAALISGLPDTGITFGTDPLMEDSASILAIVGATGVGKTTTVAKLAARMSLHEGRRVELVTLDTYRIAAVAQLKTYAEIIGAKCHIVGSTLELDSLLRRLPQEATVLIDTTGRSPYDLSDQFDLCDYMRSRREIRKCLAIPAPMNTIDAVAAIRKFEVYGADCLAITKMDETIKPGAVLDFAAGSGLPLVYFGTGQRVPEDLRLATREAFANHVLGENIRQTGALFSRSN